MLYLSNFIPPLCGLHSGVLTSAKSVHLKLKGKLEFQAFKAYEKFKTAYALPRVQCWLQGLFDPNIELT
jgi:hypothetical protein